MFSYSKEYFEGLIEHIENDIAHVRVIGNNEELSFMEIPKNDLIPAKINFKAGILFSFVLKQFCGWEKIIFSPIKRKSITQEQMNTLTRKYKEKYGDV